MDFQIEFPEIGPEVTVETALMKRTVRRTLGVHRESAIVVWTGPSRLGKTTTARWLVEKITAAYDPEDPRTFRAHHYEVGAVPKWFGDAQKRAIRSLYHATIGRLDDTVYRTVPSEDLARQLVLGLARKNVQLVLVDEAGLLSLEAIRGLVLVRDVAKLEEHRLSFVLIGMDDLPVILQQCPQVSGRVLEWCYFEPYSLKETWQILAELHPHFARLDPEEPAHVEQVAFLHETYGGVPGLLTAFLCKLDSRIRSRPGEEVSAKLLRAIHLMTVTDRDRAIKNSTRAAGRVATGEAADPRPERPSEPAQPGRRGGSR